jgi:hypothetical protein
MKKLKIYIENSVIGGYFDKEFEESTKKLFQYFEKDIYIPVISTHIIDELNDGAPEYIIDNLNNLNYDQYDVTNEMINLKEKYMESNIVTEKYSADALHIAIATVINVDVLVSWNFKHIVNLEKIKKFNAINLTQGYHLLEIRTPQEVINYE